MTSGRDFSTADDEDARALTRVLSGSRADPTDQRAVGATAKAEADIELIRTALRTIGDQAATSARSVTTGSVTTDRGTGHRSRRWLAAGAVGATAAVLAVWFAGGQFGAESPVNPPGSGRPSAGAPQAQLSYAGAVACSRIVAEGTVIAVADGAKPGRVDVSFAVRRWFKPAREPGRITLDVPDPAAEGVHPRWLPGEHLLVMVSVDPKAPMSSYTGAEIAENRAWIEPALPEAARIACPVDLLPVS